MIQSELIYLVAKKTGLSHKLASLAVTAAIESITEALSSGDSVKLTGFGNFETRIRHGRLGRDPRTGARINIAESRTIAFKAGNKLKHIVNSDA
ncbi:MAG: DNA-binding protein [Paenibacillus sp.]|jgi:nucleoid DNA-binding protein|nr:DNA-binding protein [Paenibacillus sp.]